VEVRRAYCSAVDRNVPVRLRAGVEPRHRVSLYDPSDLVCLDYKVRCTGWCCPLYSVADDAEPVPTRRRRSQAVRASASHAPSPTNR
jgi:hypothetical protein